VGGKEGRGGGAGNKLAPSRKALPDKKSAAEISTSHSVSFDPIRRD
jgi:hypothetical protein